MRFFQKRHRASLEQEHRTLCFTEWEKMRKRMERVSGANERVPTYKQKANETRVRAGELARKEQENPFGGRLYAAPNDEERAIAQDEIEYINLTDALRDEDLAPEKKALVKEAFKLMSRYDGKPKTETSEAVEGLWFGFDGTDVMLQRGDIGEGVEGDMGEVGKAMKYCQSKMEEFNPNPKAASRKPKFPRTAYSRYEEKDEMARATAMAKKSAAQNPRYNDDYRSQQYLVWSKLFKALCDYKSEHKQYRHAQETLDVNPRNVMKMTETQIAQRPGLFRKHFTAAAIRSPSLLRGNETKIVNDLTNAGAEKFHTVFETILASQPRAVIYYPERFKKTYVIEGGGPKATVDGLSYYHGKVAANIKRAPVEILRHVAGDREYEDYWKGHPEKYKELVIAAIAENPEAFLVHWVQEDVIEMDYFVTGPNALASEAWYKIFGATDTLSELVQLNRHPKFYVGLMTAMLDDKTTQTEAAVAIARNSQLLNYVRFARPELGEKLFTIIREGKDRRLVDLQHLLRTEGFQASSMLLSSFRYYHPDLFAQTRWGYEDGKHIHEYYSYFGQKARRHLYMLAKDEAYKERAGVLRGLAKAIAKEPRTRLLKHHYDKQDDLELVLSIVLASGQRLVEAQRELQASGYVYVPGIKMIDLKPRQQKALREYTAAKADHAYVQEQTQPLRDKYPIHSAVQKGDPFQKGPGRVPPPPPIPEAPSVRSFGGPASRAPASPPAAVTDAEVLPAPPPTTPPSSSDEPPPPPATPPSSSNEPPPPPATPPPSAPDAGYTVERPRSELEQRAQSDYKTAFDLFFQDLGGRSLTHGIEWFKKGEELAKVATEKGDSEAQVHLALAKLRRSQFTSLGGGGEEERTEARNLIVDAIENKDSYMASLVLGSIYLAERDSAYFGYNPQEALRWFKKAHELAPADKKAGLKAQVERVRKLIADEGGDAATDPFSDGAPF